MMASDLISSKVKPELTIEYMTQPRENKYYDRKSAQIKPSDLAPLISAFANAEGGTIVIGISDKTRRIEGINAYGDEKINNFIAAPKDFCHPMPVYTEEFIDLTNDSGQPDRILLLHIEASMEDIVRTETEAVYLRIGDRSKELKGEDLRNLEYAKGARNYEDEPNFDASIDDLDTGLVEDYKRRIGASGSNTEKVLRSRRLMVSRNGKWYPTNAAMLLFAKEPYSFYPQCRVRFLRYEGTTIKTGKDFNVVKDKNFTQNILCTLSMAQTFIADQLRAFTTLGPGAVFVTKPEYPEFTWQEGLANALAHRLWSLRGDYIRISMFDDRLEIFSPGQLPNVVTVENICEMRFARNATICQILEQFGYVKQLNEGVKRIFSEMEEAGLPAPEITDTPSGVRLILRNNAELRKVVEPQNGSSEPPKIGNEPQNEPQNGPQNNSERKDRILAMIKENALLTKKEIAVRLGVSESSIQRDLTELRKTINVEWKGPSKGGHWEIERKISK